MSEQIKNTAPMTNELGQKLSRKFLGKMENFENKTERNYYTKMLRAYLKGASQFVFGKDSAKNPRVFHVQQQYFYR